VLAALSGLGIDNCEVWVDAEEMPGCDGSAREFVAAIDVAGIVEQRQP
jgi:UDP-3-O-acyl-N-acetylglucosamine deacetylase